MGRRVGFLKSLHCYWASYLFPHLQRFQPPSIAASHFLFLQAQKGQCNAPFMRQIDQATKSVIQYCAGGFRPCSFSSVSQPT